MCTLYTMPSATHAQIKALLRDKVPAWLPHEPPHLIHAYARPIAPIILEDGSCVPASWTYMPPPSADATPEQKKAMGWQATTFNTVGEEMFVKRTWSEPARLRHCLVPAVSYTEHQHRGKVTVPYRMALPGDSLFFFAGLYKFYPQENVFRFSIITMPPNKLQRFVHNSRPRQPLILIPGKRDAEYLEAKTPEKMLPLLCPSDDDGMLAEVGVGLNGKVPERLPDPPEWDDSPLTMPEMATK